MNFSFDVLAQISSGTNMFSDTENKLARYILTDPTKVLSLSIADLANSSGVSVATVSRFCKRLSLNGYQEFRLELMKSVSNANTAQTETNALPSSVTIISRVAAIHTDSVNKAHSALEAERINLASEMIHHGTDVHFLGCGTMLLMALIAKHQFMQVSTKFRCDFDPAMQALSTSLMTKTSVAVIFSYTGSTRDIVEIAQMAKNQGAKIIAITRYQQSPLTELSDVVIICGVSEGPFQAGSSAVQAAMLYIIDVLFTEFCERNSIEAERNKQKTSTAVIGKIHPLKINKKISK